MRLLIAAAAVLLLLGQPAFAQSYSDPKALLEALYAGYMPPNDFPPDETAPLSVPWTYGPVCSGGRIEISAFYAA